VSTRTPLAAANWKMHLTSREARELCAALAPAVPASGVEVAVFPSFPLIPAVAEALAETPATWGGQDLHPEEQGAFTGDVSGVQLADLGCRWVLVGHSERRHYHGESEGLLAAKLAAAGRSRLAPVLCVGESREQRGQGRTFEVLSQQLEGALEGGAPRGLTLAYEPVWAIGTGETATPELAQEAHRFLRQRLVGHLGSARAQETRILYGGSVKGGNAAQLAAQADIDGFLVGGASLDGEEFSTIIRSLMSGAQSR
jgi:triosephosphate isomerase (TIM)